MDNLKDFMQEWQALHPPPQTQAADNKWLRFGLGLAVICSFVVSAHRTVEAFGGDIWAVFAVGMIEIGITVLAYGLADKFHGKLHDKVLLFGSIIVVLLTFAVVIGGNVYISLKHAGDADKGFEKTLAILTGVIAPLMLFVGMELLSSWKRTQDRRVEYKIQKWENDQAAAWDKRQAMFAGEPRQQISAPAKASHSKNVNAKDHVLEEWAGLTKRDLAAKSLKEWQLEFESKGIQVGRSTIGLYRSEELQNGRAE
jgi:hypothetical protein